LKCSRSTVDEREHMEDAESDQQKPNRLIAEISPYLLQHAWNPVDWHPWGEEAFSNAEEHDRMIFLSIGYATCHWCHVMEKESFEDPEVASVLNQNYVPIKVDREERPDLDQLYMAASQALSGSGGWPLNVVLTPDRKPFFVMTYMPRERRFGNPGIIEILTGIAQMWQEDRQKLLAAADSVVRKISEGLEKGRSPQRSALKAGFESLRLNYDRVNGGFGLVPKFPLPNNLLFLLRYAKIRKDEKAAMMVETTLRSMAMGGIYDHIGYGFHRYSTDSQWLVPHFEKMLYDQALVSMALIEIHQFTGNSFYGQKARECLEFVMREMTSPEGGFYSAQDADTGGEEGGYYLWTRKEVEKLLSEKIFRVAANAWHLTTAGNFIDNVSGERTGKNIIHLARKPDDLARQEGMSLYELESILESARTILYKARGLRERPLTDEKVLADWNGLMIAAFSRAARAFSDARYSGAAEKAAGFILGRMRTGDGGLLHRFRDNTVGIEGMAMDYAFFIFGLTDLYMATFRPGFLSAAVELQHTFDDRFWDERRGGYFSALAGKGDLITRQKDVYDGAIPSANSVAFTNLIRLSLFTGDPFYEKRASELAKIYTTLLSHSPAAYTFFLTGLSAVFGPATSVVILPGEDPGAAEEMIRALELGFYPFTVVLKKTHDTGKQLSEVAAFTKEMVPIEEKCTSFICSRKSCSRPVTSVQEMLSLVEK
jgi:uncharacterized protein YyaL (SSP411 family)